MLVGGIARVDEELEYLPSDKDVRAAESSLLLLFLPVLNIRLYTVDITISGGKKNGRC